MNNEPSRELGSGHWAHGEGYEGTITTYVPTTYLEEDEHPAVDDGASPVLVPPDLTGQWWRQPDQGGAWRDDDHGGVIVAAVTGILVAAVATGVATFAAALVRPQASPAGAAGGVLFARIPASLSHLMVALFGAYAQAVLLLAAIGLVAAVFGVLAGRNQIVGVAGLASSGLLAAFITITRPEGQASDVVPSAIGAIAGIMALLLLIRASAPGADRADGSPAYQD